jgi:integrase
MRKKAGYSVRVYPKRRKTKTKDGKTRKYTDWYAIISLNGKEVESIRANPNTQAQAKLLADSKRVDLGAGDYVPNAEAMTIQELARKFIEWFEPQCFGSNATRSDGTLRSYRSNLGKHILPRFGPMPLTRATHLFPDYVMELRGEYEANTVRSIYRLVLAMFRYAHKVLKFPDLLKNVHVDLPPQHTRGHDEIITFDEFSRVLRFLDSKPEDWKMLEWLQSVVIICLTGLQGLRVGEVSGTDCEHCDLENWKQNVKQQMRGTSTLAPPKYNSARSIDHDAITHKALTDLKDFLGGWSGPLLLDNEGKRANSKIIRYKLPPGGNCHRPPGGLPVGASCGSDAGRGTGCARRCHGPRF